MQNIVNEIENHIKKNKNMIANKPPSYIFDIRLGNSISNNVMKIDIGPQAFSKLFKTLKEDYKYKYLINKIYKHEDFEYVVDLSNDHIKCNKNIYFNQTDATIGNRDFRLVIREKKRINTGYFSCKQSYNNEFLREILSFDIEDRLKLNLILRRSVADTDEDEIKNYEVNLVYFYNADKHKTDKINAIKKVLKLLSSF
jgi:hypothetical protein